MDLCKTCMFMEVDKERKICWCILKKNDELTNYSKVDSCEDYISNYIKTA